MIPAFEGVIARRILLNFRADPAVVRRIVPAPLELDLVNRHAVVGICLIRLERLRPRGLPAWLGLASENMAHRFAVRIPRDDTFSPGVYIARRDTVSRLVSAFGGRTFPGFHHVAKFDVADTPDRLDIAIRTASGEADVHFAARPTDHWPDSRLFTDLAAASRFFEQGACGYSCARDGRRLEGLELRTLHWSVRPLAVESLHAAFFDDALRFPAGSIAFDHALIMRQIPHQWHSLPSLAVATA